MIKRVRMMLVSVAVAVLVSLAASTVALGWSGSLMDAAANGHAAVVRLLLVRNVDVNAVDGKNDNALGVAERAGNETVAKLLTDAGAKAPKKK